MTDPETNDAPETRRDDSELAPARSARDPQEDGDTDWPREGADAADDVADDAIGDGVDDAPAAAGGGPPLIVLIGSALLLLAIGAGMAMAFAPNRAAPSSAPTAAAGSSAAAGPPAAAADLPTSAVPTALPLPQAIGDVTSTEPVAQVGATTITRGEFVRSYQPGALPSDVLKQLIQVELVVQQAAIEGVTIDEGKIDAELVLIKQQNSINDDAAFAAFLQQNDIGSEDELRKLIGRSQLIDQMLLAHTTLEQAHARHILLATTEETVDTRKAEAEALLKQLQDGADFVQVASEKSEDPGSKDSGGDLGWAPRGAFVPAFDEAIFSMEKDELRLVQSEYGWHIIQLLDLPEVRALASREMLNTASGQQAFSETFLPWLDQLQSEAEAAQKIKILVTDDQLVAQP